VAANRFFLLTAWLGLALGSTVLASPPEAPAVRVLHTAGLKMESVALLMSGEQGGSIHVAVLPLLFPGAGGRVRVPIVLEIDGATLLKGNQGDLARVEVCLYAMSRKAGASSGGAGSTGGIVQGSLLEVIEADLARAGSGMARSGLQYAGELSLAPGDYSLRVLVRNALTGEVGLRLLSLTVPDFGTGPLLLSPVFPNPAAGSWVTALSKTARTSPAALADGALPAAQPVLGADQEARFEVPAWKLKPEALRVEVLRPDGGRAAELPARIEARREAAGLEWITVSFRPAGLETGRYLIRTTIPGTTAPAWASPFVLLPGGGGGKVWAELMHPGQSPSQEAGRPEPARPRRRKLDAGPIRDAYRQALGLLAGGDEAAARRAVAALEAPLLTGPTPASPEDVAEIELGVARDLAATHPRIVLPVALLHESLYREAQQHRDFVLAAHTRELVFGLADLCVARGSDAAGRRTAVRLLLGLASHLAESASDSLRDRIFRQILAYDKDEAAAHLYLAAKAEHEARYPEAVTHLEALLRTHPEDAEARVRLAVSLRRLGKPADADRLLDGLIKGLAAAPGTPESTEATEAWVLALAYQETGRALLAAGRLDEAERFLRAALERLPGDEKLLLELATVFDLRNDPAQARQVLAGFHPVRGGDESPRHRYNRLPTGALDRAWSDLVRSAPEGLPALAEALRPAARKGAS
jgi:Flp pilus assembly protein TadD